MNETNSSSWGRQVQQGEAGSSTDVFRAKDAKEPVGGQVDLGKLENVESSANRIKEDVYKYQLEQYND